MRTVFTNSMCAHVWAQLSQPHGRSGSMKFDGAVAYSYSTPVAHIITPQGRAPVALFVPNRWGVTTGAHLREYRDAARHLPQFEVPELFEHYKAQRVRDAAPDVAFHTANLDALRANYAKERDALMRVPCDSYRVRALATEDRDGNELPRDLADDNNVSAAHVTLCRLAGVLNDYASAFGLAVTPLPWQHDGDLAVARRDRIANDPKREAKRAAGAAQREAAKAKARERAIEAQRVAALEAAERVALWQSGAEVRLNYGDVPRERGALLRLRDGKVETSQGAEAPASHVARVLEVLYTKIQRGQSWQRDTRYSDDRQESYTRLGHFRIDSIDADGNVRAGCHHITAAEVSRIKLALELAGIYAGG